MRFKRLGKLISIFGLVLAAAALAGVGSPFDGPKAGPKADDPRPSARVNPSGGYTESVQVHGHWTIEVSNPGGPVVNRTEFENAVAPRGLEYLTRTLAHNATPGVWTVELGGRLGDDAGPCGPRPPRSAQGLACKITEPTNLLEASPRISKNLEVRAPARTAGASLLRLSGQITAVEDSAISEVST
jgi:hypothetical protein